MNWYKIANNSEIDVAEYIRQRLKSSNPDLDDEQISNIISSIDPNELTNEINGSGNGLKAETNGTDVCVSYFEGSNGLVGKSLNKIDNLNHDLEQTLSKSKSWRKLTNKLENFLEVRKGTDIGKQFYGNVPGA